VGNVTFHTGEILLSRGVWKVEMHHRAG